MLTSLSLSGYFSPCFSISFFNWLHTIHDSYIDFRSTNALLCTLHTLVVPGFVLTITPPVSFFLLSCLSYGSGLCNTSKIIYVHWYHVGVISLVVINIAG